MRHCLKVIKHLFRRGVKPQLRRNIETCVLYFDGPNNFSSQHHLEASFDG